MQRLLDGLTVIVLVAAVAFFSRSILAREAPERDRLIDGWEQLADAGYRIGPESAAVQIVEWGDYQCPGCRSIAPRLDEVLSDFPADVSLVYRHWPLDRHPFARLAAMTVECAADQGQFEQVHSALYATTGWATAPSGDSTAALIQLAVEAGVKDRVVLETCVKSRTHEGKIDRDVEAVRSLGGRGTPTILINGVLSPGYLTDEEIRDRIGRILR